MSDRICSVDDCHRPVYCRGWCVRHYFRWKRHGDPTATTTVPSVESRFWAKVNRSGDCWLWTAATTSAGYGQFRVDGRWGMAHRFAYELLVGPIPQDLQIDHLCRTPLCVNPAHLEPVTQQENLRRGIGGPRTHCPAGHPYDETNTYVYPVTGGRYCRACGRAAHRARYASQRSLRE
jgi:hypothetical protein